MNGTRRSFLAGAMIAPLLLAARASAAGERTVCYDPDTLPLSQRSRRRALGYADSSADPHKRCDRCSFFTTGTPGCGTCAMLGGGAVSAGGLCGSFAPRAG